MKSLITALSEFIEARAERHREAAATRLLNCRWCGCGALNGLDDDE